MQLALISDVHANLHALKSVLTDIRNRDKTAEIIFLGDAVGYGANPNEVVNLLEKECTIKLMEIMTIRALGMMKDSGFNIYARASLDFTAGVLTEQSKILLSKYQLRHEVSDMLLLHSTPYDITDWNYCLNQRDAQKGFSHFSNRVCFLGHTHLPTVFSFGPSGETQKLAPVEMKLEKNQRYMANVGSVGQPRDGDSRACYCLYDSETMKLEFVRVEYDIEAQQKEMLTAGLPEFLIQRLVIGR